MSKLLIITSGWGYTPRRIKEEAEKKGIEVVSDYYRNISIAFGSGKTKVYSSGLDINDFDYLVFRGAGTGYSRYHVVRNAIANYCQYSNKKIKVLNGGLFSNSENFDKLSQHILLEAHGLPVIRTRYFASQKQIDNSNFEFPIVVKAITGSLGQQVTHVEELYQLQLNIGKYLPHNVLIQESLESREDIRVIVINNRALGAMKRTAPRGGFHSNLAAGGSAQKIELTQELTKLAVASAQACSADYCGVDIMYQDGKAVILEVNPTAHTQGFEKCLGVNVSENVIDFLLSH